MLIDIGVNLAPVEHENTPSCSRREFYRKINNLSSVLEKLNKEQSKILRESLEQVDSDVIDVLVRSNVDNINSGKIVNRLMNYLKTFSFYSKEDQVQFGSLVYCVCRENLFDDNFFQWFCKRIDKRPSRVTKLVNNTPFGNSR